MKINYLLVFLISLVVTRAFAQTWSPQTSGTTEHLISISFTDGLHGCAVGYGGVILKTVNGGASWTQQNSGTTDRFYSVHFTSANTGWAVGDAGLIRRTADGGNTWTAVNPPVSADFRVVWFLDNQTGFIGGGFSSTLTTILKTTDGGNTWTDISPTNLIPQQVVYGIFFTSPNIGYAADYDGRILKTTNGGASWTAQTIAPNYNLHAVYFTDTNTGYVAGGNIPGNSGVILKTLNGGNTWSTYSLSNGFLTDIKFLDANTGYAIGGSLANNTSIILKTTNAGNNWTTENTSSSRQFRAFFPNNEAGYSCGLDGTILKLASPAPPTEPCDNTFIKSLTNMGGSQPNIFPDPGGDFYATGMRNDSIVVVRFDQGGSPQWARAFRLGNDVLQIRDMFVDESGDLIGVAFYETSFLSEIRSAAFRYNIASHSFVWVRYLAGVNYSNIQNADVNNCVATGTTFVGYTHLIRLDKNTGAVSGYNLAGDSGDYYSTIHNGILYGSCRRYYNGFQTAVFAHDLNSGAFLWQNTIVSEPDAFNSTRMYPVEPVIDNNEIVVPASGDLQGFNVYLTGPVELVMAKTTLTGDVLWTRQYVIDGFDRPLATAVVSTDGGYYLVANLYSATMGYLAYSVLIKTNKQGEVQWAKRLGISGKNIAKNVMERDGFLYLTMASDSYAPNDLLLLKLDPNGDTEAGCDFVQPIAVETLTLANFQEARNYDTYDSGIALEPQSAVSTETGQEMVTYCSTPCICPGLFVSVEPDTTICAGESVQLIYSSNGTFTSFNWSPAAGLSCSDCPTPLASPASTTVYHLEATAEDGCIKYDSVTIEVLQPAAFTQNITTCENEPFEFNGNVYSVSGAYVDHFIAANGCDSVVTTNLVVLPLLTRAETIEFCAGESVVIGGVSYTQSGTVVQTLPGAGAACDTVVTYTLTALPLPTRAETIEFCAGESVVIGGVSYTQSGTVVQTLPGAGAACDTVVTYTLVSLTPAPSNITIQCPEAVNIGIDPGAGPTQAFYDAPTAWSDCPCPGIAVSLTAGLPSGALFPTGTTQVCYTATDSCGNPASCCFDVIIREAQACDIKEIGCIKYELLTITADAQQNRTYRIRVTNQCASAMIYTAIQLPDGMTALDPPHLSVYEAPSGREYDVRNPNYSPFYSVRFKSTGNGIANGQSDIFEYTLPAQAQPVFIHIATRLASQVLYEAHLNTFYCPIGVTPDGDKAAERTNAGLPDWSALRLYPNPNPGVFTVKLPAPAESGCIFRVTDLTGQLVLEKTAEPNKMEQTIQADELPSGLYFLQIVVEGRVQATVKFVKQ